MAARLSLQDTPCGERPIGIATSPRAAAGADGLTSRVANRTRQYGSMMVACMVYPASPTSLRNACVLITPVTHTGSNSSFIG